MVIMPQVQACCRVSCLDSGKRATQDTGSLVPLHWFGFFSCAALIASGGIIGYAKAGGVPSLAAGLLFGGLSRPGRIQVSQDPRNIWVFLVTSGTLAGIMGMRFYHSGKFMPAGLIAGASLLMVAKVGISMLNRPHQ
ncbi:PREDICTED: transmembrane protein 14C-like [Galeopterus variegatus]|uniref:Transmembrane protein 14C n=1 Tax=Galeopterus variegatus TaxID=482537 RepID=A0ABM0RK42_GALVR|nr:PREDICTED: transmembrane protein 14C-like [Galeopterus variegatus]